MGSCDTECVLCLKNFCPLSSSQMNSLLLGHESKLLIYQFLIWVFKKKLQSEIWLVSKYFESSWGQKSSVHTSWTNKAKHVHCVWYVMCYEMGWQMLFIKGQITNIFSLLGYYGLCCIRCESRRNVHIQEGCSSVPMKHYLHKQEQALCSPQVWLADPCSNVLTGWSFHKNGRSIEWSWYRAWALGYSHLGSNPDNASLIIWESILPPLPHLWNGNTESTSYTRLCVLWVWLCLALLLSSNWFPAVHSPYSTVCCTAARMIPSKWNQIMSFLIITQCSLSDLG